MAHRNISGSEMAISLACISAAPAKAMRNKHEHAGGAVGAGGEAAWLAKATSMKKAWRQYRSEISINIASKAGVWHQ